MTTPLGFYLRDGMSGRYLYDLDLLPRRDHPTGLLTRWPATATIYETEAAALRAGELFRGAWPAAIWEAEPVPPGVPFRIDSRGGYRVRPDGLYLARLRHPSGVYRVVVAAEDPDDSFGEQLLVRPADEGQFHAWLCGWYPLGAIESFLDAE